MSVGVSITARNWNEDFQTLFDNRPPKDAPVAVQIDYAIQLNSLSREFIDTARKIGKIIIDEVFFDLFLN